MRQINIIPAPNGGVSFTTVHIFNNEHNSVDVSIDYSKVDYEDYLKRAEVIGSPTSLVFEGSGNLLSFTIDRALLGGRDFDDTATCL